MTPVGAVYEPDRVHLRGDPMTVPHAARHPHPCGYGARRAGHDSRARHGLGILMPLHFFSASTPALMTRRAKSSGMRGVENVAEAVV